MTRRVMPMIHVLDVESTADWYASIGFSVLDRGRDGDAVVFAMLAFGDSRLLLSAGGTASGAHRREVDLYVETDDLETAFAAVSGRAEIVEGPHDAFYGMREFIIRDPNGFWITFGQSLKAR